MYIIASSAISFQPTFRNRGFSSHLTNLESGAGIVHPDYSEFIPAMARRRMSDVLKMAITCTLDCLTQAELEQPDAIIVGTSSGCCQFTKKFLDNIFLADGNLISPTAFTLSTHNTVAGQISLLLGNHNYNITHSHNSLSFEHALIDSILCIQDGKKHILVGASEEAEDSLFNLGSRLSLPGASSAAGASFFFLSAEKTNSASIRLVDVLSYTLLDDLPKTIAAFLNTNGSSPGDIDVVLYSGSRWDTTDELSRIFSGRKLFDFQKSSGIYLTNSAFGVSTGVDMLLQGSHPHYGSNIRRVLICNNLIPENLGLVLLEKNTR